MSLQGWQILVCDCGNKFFHQTVTVAWHENQGTTIKPEGFTCTGCGKRSDQSKMVAVVKERLLQTKIDELRAQQV